MQKTKIAIERGKSDTWYHISSASRWSSSTNILFIIFSFIIFESKAYMFISFSDEVKIMLRL